MTTLYQLKLDQSLVNCGMSYVYQLSSRHFFLIDGGYFTPGEADRLYDFLRARCEGKPVIEGWFFSHAHQDHIGAFLDMMERHREGLEIRQLMYAFQPLDLPESSDGWREQSNDLATVRRFYEIREQCCADVPVRTLHTGDSLRIGELTVEVLFTYHQLDEPSTFNDNSAVIRVGCEGQWALFLGDAYVVASRYMLSHCPEKLRCDLVQVSHHGFKGATRELYEATGAKVALWPAPDYEMKPNASREANHYLLFESSVQEHFLSDDGDAAFSLPYRIGTAEGTAFPPEKYLPL